MRLIRFVLVLLGVAALLVAGAALAAEILTFAADGKLFAKPLGKIWFDLHKNSLLLLQPAIERYLHPWLWGGIVQPLLERVPLATTGAFGVLGLVLIGLGRRGRRRRA
jgi:hypothetical protein